MLKWEEEDPDFLWKVTAISGERVHLVGVGMAMTGSPVVLGVQDCVSENVTRTPRKEAPKKPTARSRSRMRLGGAVEMVCTVSGTQVVSGGGLHDLDDACPGHDHYWAEPRAADRVGPHGFKAPQPAPSACDPRCIIGRPCRRPGCWRAAGMDRDDRMLSLPQAERALCVKEAVAEVPTLRPWAMLTDAPGWNRRDPKGQGQR